MRKGIIILLLCTPIFWSCEKQELEELYASIREIAWNNVPDNGKAMVNVNWEVAPVNEMILWEEPTYQVVFATSDSIYGNIFCYIAKDDWEFLGFGDISVNYLPEK